MQYAPSPTVQRFMQSRAFVKILCGPVGGGKSTGALMALWMMATEQAPFNNVRRSKFCILRNTSAMLKSTVKPLIDQWFVELPLTQHGAALGQWRLTPTPCFEVRARLPDGTIVHTEFELMHADTPDDVRRLLSVEFTAAWVEEAREVDGTVFEGLQGRVARFPNQASGGQTYPCVICSTNPPPVGTYWHTLMVDPPKNVEVFMQPAAILDDGSINPDAENLQHLNPMYYQNLLEGKTDDWINVYLRNKFGAGGMGQPVFRATWRSDFHVAKAPLKPIPVGMKRVIVGSDNGLTAAAVIAQEDARGKINLIQEAYVPEGESMGYDRFMDTLLIPKLRDLGIPHTFVLFVVDPACFHRSQANEVTIAQVIQARHFTVVPAPTNVLERRITSVEGLLMQQVGGEARFCVSPVCTHTIAAMEWGYRNKKTAGSNGVVNPDKGFYSHIADAVQCVGLYYNQGAGGAAGMSTAAKPVVRQDFAYT